MPTKDPPRRRVEAREVVRAAKAFGLGLLFASLLERLPTRGRAGRREQPQRALQKRG